MKSDVTYKKFIIIFFIIAIFVLSIGSFFRTFEFWLGRLGNDFFAPYLKIASFFNRDPDDLKYAKYKKSDLIQEIKKLKKSNNNLVRKTILYDKILEQNRIFRNKLQLPEIVTWRTINGEVILRNPTDWLYFFTINRGAVDGVKKGAAVYAISENFQPILLGIIDNPYKNSAKVMSIYHPKLKISGQLGNSKVIGLLNVSPKLFSEKNTIPIGYLPRKANYQIGEDVFTTGFEDNIPAGLKIGTLKFVDNGNSLFSNELYINGTVLPANDFNQLSLVTVVSERVL